jgi:peptidoglycan/xylan/chitin deacetylase (PgdA/CDA1 family)
MNKGRTIRKAVIWALVSLAALAALVFASWAEMRSRTFQFFGGIVSRVETGEKVVALTFDDGPSGRTDEVLSILDEEGIKATFFLVGQSMEEFPGETKRIAQAGHQIGNHTYSHGRMVLRSLSYIGNEMEKTDALIRGAGYQGDIVFRPPGCKKFILLPYYLHQHDVKTITWDIEPNSYPDVNASSENIVKYVLDNIKPGSIILLHVMYDEKGASIKALKGIAEGLKAEGYTFVTVNELLRYNK